MALEGFTTSNYLSRSGAIVTDQPLFVHAWAFVDADSADAADVEAVWSQGNADADQNWSLFRWNDDANTQRIKVIERGGVGSNSLAIATANHGTGAWFPCAVAFLSSTLRVAWNGTGTGNVGTNTETRDATMTGTVLTYIGLWRSSPALGPWPAGSAIAEVSCWTWASMAQSECQELYELMSTLSGSVYPNVAHANGVASEAWTGNAVSHWRLNTSSDINDLIGSNHMTLNGSLNTFGSHPNVGTPGAAGSIALPRNKSLRIDPTLLMR